MVIFGIDLNVEHPARLHHCEDANQTVGHTILACQFPGIIFFGLAIFGGQVLFQIEEEYIDNVFSAKTLLEGKKEMEFIYRTAQEIEAMFDLD
jgi:hypothetical protein